MNTFYSRSLNYSIVHSQDDKGYRVLYLVELFLKFTDRDHHLQSYFRFQKDLKDHPEVSYEGRLRMMNWNESVHEILVDVEPYTVITVLVAGYGSNNPHEGIVHNNLLIMLIDAEKELKNEYKGNKSISYRDLWNNRVKYFSNGNFFEPHHHICRNLEA